MIAITNFIQQFPTIFAKQEHLQPWEMTVHLADLLADVIHQLGETFRISNGVAIHNKAKVEAGTILKPPAIIEEGCFVAAAAYLRSGVYIGKFSTIGPGCEIKTSIICCQSSLAHFNFVGDSIIGSNVNFEAGSVIANHYNERSNKKISVLHNSTIINTNIEKFGALVGDGSRIGANAVLSPGTILQPQTIVKRLELIEQIMAKEN